MPSPPTQDAPPGTGTTKSASPAPKTGSSMLTKFAFPSLISANLTPKTVTAPHASRDTTSRKDSVSSLTSTMPSPPTPDAPPGTGTTKSASPAPKTGASMLTKFAFPSLISANLMPKTVTAPHASRDTTSRKDNVSSLTSTMPVPQTLAVPPGTGITKFA